MSLKHRHDQLYVFSNTRDHLDIENKKEFPEPRNQNGVSESNENFHADQNKCAGDKKMPENENNRLQQMYMQQLDFMANSNKWKDMNYKSNTRSSKPTLNELKMKSQAQQIHHPPTDSNADSAQYREVNNQIGNFNSYLHSMTALNLASVLHAYEMKERRQKSQTQPIIPSWRSRINSDTHSSHDPITLNDFISSTESTSKEHVDNPKHSTDDVPGSFTVHPGSTTFEGSFLEGSFSNISS